MPRGFGAAVLNARDVVGSRPFLVHAGDAYVRNSSKNILKLINAYEKNDPDIIFYLKEIPNPRAYGVVMVSKIDNELYRVNNLEEKPARPKSNLAIMPIYIFKPEIFDEIGRAHV